MAPSPVNDGTLKASDKKRIKESQKSQNGASSSNEKNPINISVASLSREQLKTLLDEAITYKVPKDRHGKSALFKSLLTDVEDGLQKSHGQSASGSKQTRYSHTTVNRKNRNKNEKLKVCENLTCDGLDDLLDDIFNKERFSKNANTTVSMLPSESGSLQCNANEEIYDEQNFDDKQEKNQDKTDAQYTVAETKTESLKVNDLLGQGCSTDKTEIVEEAKPCMNKTSKKLQEKPNSSYPNDERLISDTNAQYNILPINPNWSFIKGENGNSFSQYTTHDSKKRKKSRKGIEDAIKAEDLEGHRADIIDNVDRLVEYISGTKDKPKGSQKTKLKKHMQEGKQKQKARSSKGLKTATNDNRQKSNSTGETLTMKLDDFHSQEPEKSEDSNSSLRSSKSKMEMSKEVKPGITCSELYQYTSNENLESADFTFVTKKKNKTKKRGNSLGSRKQPYSGKVCPTKLRRVPSARPKSVCSAPHSGKLNDFSDTDSIFSLTGDMTEDEFLKVPSSYADIAKSVDKPKVNRSALLEKKKDINIITPDAKIEIEFKETASDANKKENDISQVNNKRNLSSWQNWPEIQKNVNCDKNLENVQDWPVIQSNIGIKNGKVPIKNDNIQNLKSPPKQKEYLEHFMQAKSLNDSPDNSTQQLIQKVSEQHQLMFPCKMPPNIRDVQSIEKMQLENLHSSWINNNGSGEPNETVEEMSSFCENDEQPAVVILSGGDKNVSNITFGFDVNEQLLSGDVSADFTRRFFMPKMKQPMNVDALVNYIGSEWEDVIAEARNGDKKVKYYSEDL